MGNFIGYCDPWYAGDIQKKIVLVISSAFDNYSPNNEIIATQQLTFLTKCILT